MNSLRRIFQSTALVGLAALGSRAVGQTQSFVQKTRTVNAAVLLLDADKPTGTTPLGGSGGYQYGQTAAPFAFHNLDNATGTKPDGWVFNNPYAPGVVTDDIRARYGEIYGTTAVAAPIPVSGTHITKSEGAYWTTRLSQLSESQIANYNVLLLAPRYRLSLTTVERELLRRFVDGGGVLWVDLGAVTNQQGVDPSHNLPFAVQSNSVGGTTGVYRNATSGVLDGVREVSDGDLTALNGTTPDNNSTSTLIGLKAIVSGDTNDTGLIADFAHYRQIVRDYTNNVPVIAEAKVGDGAIVVTARGAAEILNRGTAKAAINASQVPSYSNLAYEGLATRLDAQTRSAARLAVNIVSLGGEGLQPGGSARKTNAASADTPAPVLSRFNTEKPAGSMDTGYGPPGYQIPFGTTPNGPPVTYKGYLVATVGDQVVVMDAIPGRDLDGDGDPDDGIVDSTGAVQDSYRDISLGKPLDVIWVSDHLGGTLSTPVCASVPEIAISAAAAPQYADQVLVTDNTGTLHVFALTQFVNYRLVGGMHKEIFKVSPPVTPTFVADVMTNGPIPPTVYDGVAYMADSVSATGTTVGQMWMADLSTGTALTTTPTTGTPNPWYLGSSLGMPSFTAEPTIGYIPIGDSSGGVDRVAYAPGTLTTNFQPAFVSLWLGAKGEVPDSFSITTGTLQITTRAAAAGGIPIYMPTGGSPVQEQMAPHLTVLLNGVPQTNSTYIAGGPTQSGGVLTYTLAAGAPTTTDDARALGLSFRVDYSIDLGFSPTSPSQQIVRGTLRLPVLKTPNVDTSKRILGPIALTPHGTLHMIEATPIGLPTRTGVPFGSLSNSQGGDSYFAIREDIGLRGQFRVAARYTLYNAYTQTFGASPAGTAVPAVLNDADAVQKFLPGFTTDQTQPINTFTQFRYAGGVSLQNGIAFAAIDARRAGVIDVAMIAAFREEPDTAELRIGQSVPANPWISQTDWARSSPQAAVRTPQTSTLSGNSIVVDSDNGILRIENLATVVNGEITDCLSESQPIGVGSSSQTQTFRQPDAVGDRWSPLLWFGLWNGAAATSTPFVGGNEVYMPATSLLPSILTPPASGTVTPSGVVWSVDADSPTSGLYATTLANTNRPWITQQVQLVQTDPTNNPNLISASPYFRMPQTNGIANFQDFKARLNQTKLGTSSYTLGLGGGDGIVTAFGDVGLYGLSRADIVVCDEGRLLQVDSSGNPVANTFGARFSGIGNGGSVANQRELPRPVKAYAVGTSDTLVVDAGGNRIMRIGGDGSVLRSVDRVLLDPQFKPAAYRTNEPLTLKDPRDATTFAGYVYKGATNVVTNQQAVEYWIRYLVADSGNGRILELADRFAVDQNGNVLAPITLPGSMVPDPETGQASATDVAQVGVLVWQSPSLEGAANSGDYYNSVNRVYLGAGTNGRYVYVTGVSRTRPTRVSAGLDSPTGAASLAAGGGGAVVVFDPIGGTRVFDRFTMPDLRSATFFNATTSTVDGTFTTTTAANVPSQANRPFRGVQAVTSESVFVNNAAAVRVMVTDEDAVYEFDIDATTLANASANVSLAPRWMINEAAYTALHTSFNSNTNLYSVGNNSTTNRLNSTINNSRYFRPSYARRLDSGEIILVNGYTGLTRDDPNTYNLGGALLSTAYSGEVTLLDGNGFDLTGASRNLGFTFDNVRLELRTLTGIRGLVSPVFADRR